MMLQDLKRETSFPDKEIIINKTVRLRGRDAVLAFVTQKGGSSLLWMLCEFSRPEPSDDPVKENTNRQNLKKNISNAEPFPFIKEMSIGGDKLIFKSSSYSYFESNITFMYLQRFLDKNIDVSVFDGIDLSDLVLVQYESDDSLPSHEYSDKAEISLTAAMRHRQVYLGKTFSIRMEEGIPECLSFYDNVASTERFFYINKLSSYDVWKPLDSGELEKTYQQLKEEQKLSDKQVDAMKNQYIKSLESIYPRGFVLAHVVYETEDNIQLQFYDTDFLDREIHRSNSISTAMYMAFGDDNGLHGFKARTCALNLVPMGFDGSLSVELFSWYQTVPEETVWII